MKVIGGILVIVGAIGMFLSAMMFGDIGIAAGIGALASLLSGIGFIQLNKTLNKLQENQPSL